MDEDIGFSEIMCSAQEIYACLLNQDFARIGHADSPLNTATSDIQRMNLRASAILNHHLARVLQCRKPHDLSLTSDIRVQLIQFVTDISKSYGPAKFHNYEHAIHVMTSMNKLLSMAVNETPFNSFALTLSALIHDAGHTGMSNALLRSTGHDLSNKYDQNVPVAEMNSIEIGMQTLFKPEYASLRWAIIPGEVDKVCFAKILFQSILVTDIATKENVQMNVQRYEASQKGEAPKNLCPLAPYLPDVIELTQLDEDVTARLPQDFTVTANGLKDCVRNETLMMLSDIAHCAQCWSNFVKHNYRLYRELHECFKKGLSPHPSGGWFEGQIGFIDGYILPLAKRSQCYFGQEDFGNELVSNVVSKFYETVITCSFSEFIVNLVHPY